MESVEPRARMYPLQRSDLVIAELTTECLVYDRVRHRGHCLNRLAHLVLQFCDGKTSEAEIAVRVQRELKAAIGEDAVGAALEELSKARLLQEPLAPKAAGGRITRRDLNRQLAAIGLGALVVSIVVPTAAHAASGPCGHGPANCGCPSTQTCYLTVNGCVCLPSNTGGTHCPQC